MYFENSGQDVAAGSRQGDQHKATEPLHLRCCFGLLCALLHQLLQGGVEVGKEDLIHLISCP